MLQILDHQVGCQSFWVHIRSELLQVLFLNKLIQAMLLSWAELIHDSIGQVVFLFIDLTKLVLCSQSILRVRPVDLYLAIFSVRVRTQEHLFLFILNNA